MTRRMGRRAGWRAAIWAVPIPGLLAQAPAVGPVQAPVKRTLEAYTVPEVLLVNQDGARVKLKALLESGDPVIVDFIFGSCTTISPVLSAGYADLQGKLPARVRLVSISIDPENDTPKAMRDYLRRFGARPGWDFFTGKREDIDQVLHAFNAYVPNKALHHPLILIRDPKQGTWVRLSGLMSSSEFIGECKKVGIL